jgi:chromosome segregation ATPase
MSELENQLRLSILQLAKEYEEQITNLSNRYEQDMKRLESQNKQLQHQVNNLSEQVRSLSHSIEKFTEILKEADEP